MSIQPLADRVVIRVKKAEEVTKGGIFLPGTATEKPHEGEVIAVGTGKVLESGQVLPMEVAVGDNVLFAKHAGVEVSGDKDETLLIINEENILAIVE